MNWRAAVAVAPVPLGFVGFLCFVVAPRPFKALIGGEDGLLENAQFAAFSAAGALLLVRAWSARGEERVLAWAFALAGLALFVLAGEEVSWGQRWLGYPTPEFLQSRNVQGETTLHNLRGLHARLGLLQAIACGAAAFGWLLVRRPGTPAPGWRRLVPPPMAMLYFALPASFFAANELREQFTIPFVRVTQQEPFETLIAAGCLLVALEAGATRPAKPLGAPGASRAEA